MGVETQMAPAGSSIIMPDQGFVDDINSEVSNKGFLVTSTEELFHWARTGSLWWMTLWSLRTRLFMACAAASMGIRIWGRPRQYMPYRWAGGG